MVHSVIRFIIEMSNNINTLGIIIPMTALIISAYFYDVINCDADLTSHVVITSNFNVSPVLPREGAMFCINLYMDQISEWHAYAWHVSLVQGGSQHPGSLWTRFVLSKLSSLSSQKHILLTFQRPFQSVYSYIFSSSVYRLQPMSIVKFRSKKNGASCI